MIKSYQSKISDFEKHVRSIDVATREKFDSLNRIHEKMVKYISETDKKKMN